MLEGHTLGRILLPIIDNLDKYLFAISGSSSRSLGVPVSLWLITNWRSVKEKKMNKKGVDVRFFFFWPCCFQVWDKSCNASYELILSKLFIYLCLNAAKRNETKDKWFLEFPSTGAFVGSVF